VSGLELGAVCDASELLHLEGLLGLGLEAFVGFLEDASVYLSCEALGGVLGEGAAVEVLGDVAAHVALVAGDVLHLDLGAPDPGLALLRPVAQGEALLLLVEAVLALC